MYQSISSFIHNSLSLYNIINSFSFLDAFFFIDCVEQGQELRRLCSISNHNLPNHSVISMLSEQIFNTERHALIFPSVSFSHPSIFCIKSPHLITTSEDTGTCSLHVSLSHNGKQRVFQIRNKLYFLSVHQTHYILCFPVWTTIEGFSKTK